MAVSAPFALDDLIIGKHLHQDVTGVFTTEISSTKGLVHHIVLYFQYCIFLWKISRIGEGIVLVDISLGAVIFLLSCVNSVSRSEFRSSLRVW